MNPFDPKFLADLAGQPGEGGQEQKQALKLPTLPGLNQDLEGIEVPDIKSTLEAMQKVLQRRTIKLRHIHGCNCKPCPAGHYVDEEGSMYKNFDEGMSEGLELDANDPRLEKTSDANMSAIEAIKASIGKIG